MSEILKFAAGAVFLVGAGVYTSMSSADTQKRAVAHYGLTDVQVDFQKSCQKSLSRYDKEFKGGASHQVGCACVASEIGKSGSVVSEADYQKYAKVQNTIIKFAPTDDTDDMDVMGLMSELGDLEDVTMSEGMNIAGEIGDVIGTCKSARLPATAKANNATTFTGETKPRQGCSGLSQSAIDQLKKVAERNGESLEEVCARVSTSR